MKHIKSLRYFCASLLLLSYQAKAEQAPAWEQPDDTGRSLMAGAIFQNGSGGDELPMEEGSSESSEEVSPMAMRTLAAPALTAATEITPEIQAMARGLQNDPWRIYQFCSDRIRHEPYWGVKKGAALTLIEGSGNCFDTSALMVALMRAAGFQDVKFRFGMMKFYDIDLEDWLGLIAAYMAEGRPYADLTDAQIRAKFGLASTVTLTDDLLFELHKVDYLIKAGYPTLDYQQGRGFLYIPHVWVTYKDTTGTTREVDPTFKYLDYARFNIPAVSTFGYNRTTFLTGLGGTLSSSGRTITGIATTGATGLNTQLTTYTSTFQSWLRTNQPNANLDLFLQGNASFPIPGSLPNYYLSPNTHYQVAGAKIAATSWNEIPALWETKITFTFGKGFNQASNTFSLEYDTLSVPTHILKGRKLSLVSSGTTVHFRANEEVLSTFTVTDPTFQLRMAIDHPCGTLTGTSYNNFVDDGTFDQFETKTYKRDSTSAYAIVYGFDASAQHLRKSQERLDNYRKAGLTDVNWEVRTETLNSLGLNYLLQSRMVDRIATTRAKVLSINEHVFGRVAQEESYFIDVGLSMGNDQSFSGRTDTKLLAFHVTAQFASALEHSLIEQTQGPSASALSTIRVLQLANQQGIPLYLADNSNWSAVRSVLSATANKWPVFALDTIQNSITGSANVSEGAQVLVPQRGNIGLLSTPPLGAWRGYGYILASNISSGYFIQGGYAPDVYSGGYSGTPGAVSSSIIAQYGQTEPAYYFTDFINGSANYPVTTPNWMAVDPVDMATGAFVYDHTDLTCGGPMPRGLAFHRSYDSNRFNDDSQGLGNGWTHSLDVRAQRRSAARAALGGTSMQQMAATYVAVAIAMDVYATKANAKDWAVSALTIGWAADQLRDNGVSISMGGTPIEFVKMPNGTYIPPAGITMTLVEGAGGTLTMTERHGNTHNFDATGKIVSTVDLHNKSAQFAYTTVTVNGVSKVVLDQVTDCYNRKLKFTWTGGKITKVVETAGTLSRNVQFGYTGNDLTTSIDPESKTFTYQYENSRITALIDERIRIITENEYDSEGKVFKQRLHGDPGKTFELFFSGYYNAELNPAGGKTQYSYDRQGRGRSIIDPFGNESYIGYDGQNHKTAIAEPENNRPSNYRATLMTYDADHNLTSVKVPKRNSTDPNASYTKNRQYDAQLRLWKEYDFKGKFTEYTYTTKHQVETIKDRKGQTIRTNIYNPDGTIASTKNGVNKVTQYLNYDAFGNAQNIQYPAITVNGISVVPTEVFKYDARGNIREYTDLNGNKKTMTYNERRQLLETMLPERDGVTHLLGQNYDDAGNLNLSKDANGNITLVETSPTGKKLNMKLPSTDAGSGVYAYKYNSRDFLENSTDPLNGSTLSIYDLANRLKTTTDSLNRTTEMFYDGDSRVSQTKDPRGKNTFFRYDWRGELFRVEDPMSFTSINMFDANGSKDTLTNGRNKVFDFTVDDNGNQISLKTPLLKTTTTDWTVDGLTAFVQEASGDRTEFIYDDMGRKKQVLYKRGTTTINSDIGRDKNGNLTKITEGTASLHYEYDSRNQVRTYTDADNKTIGYRYDGNGNLIELIYPDGRGSVIYTWDALNHLKTVTDWANRITTFDYDLKGRMILIKRSNGTERRFTYDAGDQLTGVSEISSTGSPIYYAINRYDSGGRRDKETTFPASNSFTSPAFSAIYDDDNRLSSFNGNAVVYDNDGNLTTGPLGSSASSAYTYDSRNRLVSAGGLGYSYDPAGCRRSITTSGTATKWVTDQIMPLTRALMREKDGVVTWYVYGVGLLYEVSSTGIDTTYHYDARGSTVALSGPDGSSIIDRFEYDAYGKEIWALSNFDTPFRFHGENGVQTDSNGLLYMRARYYSPLIRRFLNADPIGFDGGSNWFAFAQSNPIQTSDPLGLYPGVPEDALPVYENAGKFIVAAADATPGRFYNGILLKANAVIQVLTNQSIPAAMNPINHLFEAVNDPNFNVGNRAEAFGKEEYFAYFKDDNAEEFARHSYWQAELARKYGPETAQMIGDLHEWGSARPEDTRRDLYNNEFAREYIAPFSNSVSDTEALIQESWATGGGASVSDRKFAYGRK